MTVILDNVRRYLLEKEIQERLLKQKERDVIIRRLKELDFLWTRYSISKVYLYGSFADMTFQKYSDIDVAIEPDIDYGTLLHLCSEVDKHLEREIDIRLLSELPFADKVREEGIIIYERKNSNTQE